MNPTEKLLSAGFIYEELVKSQKSSETLFFAYTEFEVMHGF